MIKLQGSVVASGENKQSDVGSWKVKLQCNAFKDHFCNWISSTGQNEIYFIKSLDKFFLSYINSSLSTNSDYYNMPFQM